MVLYMRVLTIGQSLLASNLVPGPRETPRSHQPWLEDQMKFPCLAKSYFTRYTQSIHTVNQSTSYLFQNPKIDKLLNKGGREDEASGKVLTVTCLEKTPPFRL